MRSDYDARIPVRDGARLLADVLRPAAAGAFPALVSISPFPRQLQNSGAPFGFIEAGASDFWVPRGYVHVVVNMRGTGGSDGTFGLFDEPSRRDAHDVVEWVAAQPWCDGQVGMLGISAFAISQFGAAIERPAHLRAIFPVAATLDLYEAAYHHGVFSSLFMTGLLGGIARLASARPELLRNPFTGLASRLLRVPAVHRRFERFNGEAAIAALAGVATGALTAPPWDDLFIAVSVDHPTRDDFWSERDLEARLDDVDVPCYLGCDWDNVPLHLPSTFVGWRRLVGRVPVRMAVMGSGGLTWPWESLHVEALAWFDHWLKGRDTGVLEGPPIRFAMPGTPGWHATDSWPPAGARTTTFELGGDGVLAAHGRGAVGARTYAVRPPGRRVVAPRVPGRLVWETPPLPEALCPAGPAELELHASTSALDTAWIATLQDVAPDGSVTAFSAGWLRAALREVDVASSEPGRPRLPCRAAQPVPPGEVVRYRVPIVDTARWIGAGHRLRLVLASDDLRDGPSIAGFRHAPPALPARNTVHPGSRLLLSILPPHALGAMRSAQR